MKELILITILLFTHLAFIGVGNAVTTVSVMSFKNKVGSMSCNQDWYWWRDNLGQAFKEMLTTELTKNSKIEIYEREHINDIYEQEVNLINSENTEAIEKGNFKKAKYTFVGAVSSYEYCAEKNKGGVALGTLAALAGYASPAANFLPELSFSKATAKVVIDLRLIETRTGRILKSVRSEGVATRTNFKAQSEIGSIDSAQETPVGEAARNAIEKSISEFSNYL